MSRIYLTRIGFNLVAGVLLMVGLAYYWLGNLAHEVAGTAMFALVFLHNVFNRRWYGRIGREKREVRGAANIALTAVLIVTMLVLLVTSVMISDTVFRFLSLDGGFTARQIHALAGYWALIVVSVHLGFRWPAIMNVGRNLLSIGVPSMARTLALRIVAAVFVVHGVWSSFALAMGTRISMQVTLDWWDFEASTVGFFIHCVAVSGMYIALTYYALRLVQPLRRIAKVTWSSTQGGIAGRTPRRAIANLENLP